MNEATPEEVRASIVPKSDQLNADDLLTGPITVTIESVTRGDREQPIIVGIRGHRPYKPCKSMRRVMIAVFSDEPAKWIGQRMTLFRDPEVTWAGVKVGGIRISHISGLDSPQTFAVTKSRGSKAEMTVHPLKPEEGDYDKARTWLASAASTEVLAKARKRIAANASFTDSQRASLLAAADARELVLQQNAPESTESDAPPKPDYLQQIAGAVIPEDLDVILREAAGHVSETEMGVLMASADVRRTELEE